LAKANAACNVMVEIGGVDEVCAWRHRLARV
jgi:hypothetical protein